MDHEATTPDLMDDLEFAPEAAPLSARMWVRENLFASRMSGFLTVITLMLIFWVVRNIVAWIWATNRGWEAVATNMRLLMVQSYPAGPEPEIINQFARIWVSVGIVIVLATMSLAVWRVGSRVAATTFFKSMRSAGALIALVAFLGPPSVDLDLLNVDVPVVGFLVRIIGSTLTFFVESALMTGGRLIAFAVGAALLLVGHFGSKATKQRGEDLSFHSLWLPVGGGALAVLALWVVPFGHYFFNPGDPVMANGALCTGACFDPGTVAITTKLPWTLLLLAGVVGYFLAKGLMRFTGQQILKGFLLVSWVLSLPVIVLFVLRDPDFNPAREGGGFDFFTATDVTVWVAFAVVGSAVIAFLSLPRLGEVGRALSGLLLIGSLTLWAFPMLMKVRILGLLFAAFAVGAQTFAGDRQARVRYIGLWVGFTTVMVALFWAIDAPGTVEVPGKSILGGLLLTFVLALTSITLSFPIGLLMALGRTSTMPIFRVVSTVYIELVRGIPFITVLIFFDLILVLFLPSEVDFDSVVMAILAGTLFSAAYLAENVRGGLQAIPKGQYEAAKAMGLSTLQLTVFIVLPQALRAVIPALVGQTIAIFKDTSLVAIIGLFDFLFIADKVIPGQTIFLGIKLENIVFISLVYWIFTFSFSRASLRLEKRVGLGER
jgi:general L-amino acid transport system permease protein